MKPLEVGKLYRHKMLRTHPNNPIMACIVKRSSSNPAEWVGGINSIVNITEYADCMMFVENSQWASPASALEFVPVFLIGDRFAMIDAEFVEAV